MLPQLIALLGGGGTIASTFLAVWGGSGAEAFYDCAIDSSGNTILVGTATSTGVIGSSDGIVVKLGPSGTLQWAKTYGASTKLTTFYGVDIDSSNDIIVAGWSEEPGYGSADGIVMKLSGADGSITWQRELGGANTDVFYAVAVDSSGNVAATGQSNGDVITSYWNSSGTHQWQRTLAQSGTNELGSGICFDASGNVYIAANTQTSARAIIAKYNSSGTIQWQKQLSVSTNIMQACDIAVDSSGNPHVMVGNQTANEAYTIKLDSSASSITWQRKLATASFLVVNPAYGGIRIDTSGNVFSFYIGVATTTMGVIAKYNSSGTIQWQNRIRDDNNTDTVSPYGIAVDETNGFVALACLTDAVGAGGNDGLLFHVPMAGTGTGTRNTIEYEAAGLTDSAASCTVAASSATDAAGSLTSGTSGLTSSTISLTLTVS